MIVVSGLCKSFGDVTALEDVGLMAQPGQVVALLGPNGAGKTTLVRILTTLLAPDAGSALVAGLEVVRQAAEVRRLIGVSGQFAAVDPLLTGQENLEMIGRLCHLGRRQARRRAWAMLERFGLGEAAGRLVKTYSGGMIRRLDLAASLLADPPVLMLDEPTTGLDPRSRADLWSAIGDLAAGGTTVLLTTQYLEEADRLAHRVVVLDRGRVVAKGTPANLKAALGGGLVEAHLSDHHAVADSVAAIKALGNGTPTGDPDRGMVTLPAPDGVATLQSVLGCLGAAGIPVAEIGVRRPSLDEVFLALTGERQETGEPHEGGDR